ncbi:YpmS family protein [Lactobacillus sp. DCY120]|uniref:YpmS family protein n=1 Tax=Bombilactobacillus apium TaxID=2675299 RepID=A0A850RAB3_9LACO|nr:YpmS family protein [Bombilactobacillus apium]NVY95768.1 YpmS family protein [Bombilactobacillus apium]
MQRTQDAKKHNFWKWAFWLLVILIIGTVATSTTLAFWPEKSTEPQTEESSKASSKKAIFDVALTNQQVERLANHYIDKQLSQGDIKYSLKVGEHVSLLGTVVFLGSKIHFELITDATATKTGGVQLRVRGLKVGKLGVPVEFLMFYIQHNYHFPKWVQVQSSRRLIKINLEQYQQTSSDGYYFRIQKLNLQENQLRVKVYSNKF